MLARNFCDAASDRFGLGLDAAGVGVASCLVSSVVVVALTSSESEDSDSLSTGAVEIFALLFFCVTADGLTSFKSFSPARLGLRFFFFFFVTPTVLLTSSTITSLSLLFVFFDFDFFCFCFCSATGNTLNPVKFSMNKHIVTITFLMGGGSDEAMVDLTILCIALSEEEEAPPRMDRTESRSELLLLARLNVCMGDDPSLRLRLHTSTDLQDDSLARLAR